MGWNTPTVTQKRPSVYEQLIPTLLNFAAQTGLMKMRQNWAGDQAETAADRALETEKRGVTGAWIEKGRELSPDWMNEGPNSGLGQEMGYTKEDRYGRKWKPSPTKIEPLLVDGKHVNKNLFWSTYDGKRTMVNVSPGWTGPFVATEGDGSGVEAGASYQKSPEGKIDVFSTPEKTLKRRGEEKTQDAKIQGDKEIRVAKEKSKLPPSAPKPTYRVVGSDIYRLDGEKSTLIQEGSTEQRAVSNAMHDPNWMFADEIEQSEMIDKHRRFLGKSKLPPKDYGASEHPEGTTATKGDITIITKNGKWVKQ